VPRHPEQVVALVGRQPQRPGQQESEFAMPLDEFVTETVALLESEPDAREIQVERVKFLRYGEARGDYDQVVATLNASDPHGE
jgi:short-subunit dehydrogenase involved in D-alanine esterification of teichoic acids